MGLLDDLFWNVGPDLPAFSGRRARRVLREGEADGAEVVGIEVERRTSRTVEPEYRYALDVRSAAGSRGWASVSDSRRATTPTSEPSFGCASARSAS